MVGMVKTAKANHSYAGKVIVKGGLSLGGAWNGTDGRFLGD